MGIISAWYFWGKAGPETGPGGGGRGIAPEQEVILRFCPRAAGFGGLPERVFFMTTDPRAFKRAFMDSLDSLGGLEQLFENVPNLWFWVKDRECRYVTANQNSVKMCGGRTEADLIGKNDFDFFPKHNAEAFQRDDLSVVKSGIKIVDRVEPITLEDGSIRWHSTNKMPLYGRDGTIVGVAGTTRVLDTNGTPDPVYAEFAGVIDHINRHYAQPIQIEQLARMMSLSISQFERRFKQIFQEAPVRFIVKIRVNEACKLRVNTRQPVAWIARATGFFDQSYFSKQFSRRMGMSPRQYREKYYQGG
jgi:PAS domain S-box-containing protein